MDQRMRRRSAVAAVVVLMIAAVMWWWPSEKDEQPDEVEIGWLDETADAAANESPSTTLRRTTPKRKGKPKRERTRERVREKPPESPALEREVVPEATRGPLVDLRGRLVVEVVSAGPKEGDDVTVVAEPMTGLDGTLHRRVHTFAGERGREGMRKKTFTGMAAVTWLVYIPGIEPQLIVVEPDEEASCRLELPQYFERSKADRWRAGTLLGIDHKGMALVNVGSVVEGAGMFIMRPRSGAAHRLTVSRSGILDSMVESDAESDPGPGGGVEGMVRDVQGNAIAGAVVALYPRARRDDAYPATFAFETITNAEGRFEAHGIAPGEVDVHGRHIAWGTNRGIMVQVFDGNTTEANLTLAPASAVTGIASRRNRDEVVETCPLAYVADANEPGRVIRVARDGSYRLDALTGAVRLVAAPASYFPEEGTVSSRLLDVVPGRVAQWDFVLEGER